MLEVLHMEAARDGGVGQGVGRVGLVILSTDQARNTTGAQLTTLLKPLVITIIA